MQVDELVEKTADACRESSPASSVPKRYFLRNLLSQVMMSVFYVIFGLWLVPYLINHLGLDNYSMVPLAYSFISYASILTVAVTGTVGRFVVVCLEKGEIRQANEYFNSQFVAVLVISILLVPAFALFAFFSPNIVTTPVGQEQATKLLFFAVLLSFSFSTLSGAFFVSTFAKHRFDLRNFCDAMSTLIRASVIVIFFNLLRPSIWQAGQGILAAAIFGLAASFICFRKLVPELKIRIRGSFDRKKFMEMGSMGTWMTVSQLGVLLYLNVNMLVVNKALGPAEAGKYAVVLQLSNTIRPLAGAIANVLSPALMGFYARRDMDSLIRVSARAVKFMSLSMAIPLGVLCGLSRPFLEVWLGREYAGLSPLIWLMLGHLSINLSVLPLFGINLAANRIGLPAVVTIAGGLLNLALAITLASKTSLGIYGVALAAAIAFTLKNAVFTPLYAAHVVNHSAKVFVLPQMIGVLAFAGIAATSYYLSTVAHLMELWHFVAVGAVVTAIFVPAIYHVMLNTSDREFLISLFPAYRRE